MLCDNGTFRRELLEMTLGVDHVLQVLYKRKPVQFLPPVQIDNEETEVCLARNIIRAWVLGN